MATTRAGRPCASPPLRGSDYCFAHDPAMAAERKAARSKGGRARHGRQLGAAGGGRPVEVRTLGEVVALLERAINDALGLENSLQRARTVGYLAGVMIKALEAGELEERLAEVERVLKERR